MYNVRQTQQSLPPGWEAKYDQNSRKWFYIHHYTKTTQWEDPRLTMKSSRPFQFQYQAAPAKQNKTIMIADPQKVSKLKADYGVDAELARSLLCTHVNNINEVEARLRDMGYRKKVVETAAKSPASVDADPTKVSILVNLYGVREPLAQSILRTQMNNLDSSILALTDMGYSKNRTAAVEPNREYVEMLKKKYPSASYALIKSELVKANNSVTETQAALEQLGFRRNVTSSRPKQQPQKPSQPTISPQKAKAQLKKKFPTLDDTMLTLSLKVAQNNVEMATKILEAKQKKDQDRPSTSNSSTIEENKPEENKEETSRVFTPIVFESDEPGTSVTPVEIQSSTAPVFVDKNENKKDSSPPVRRRNQNAFAKKTYQRQTKKRVGGYKSSLRVRPTGPNPDLCVGPDPSLLLETLTMKKGPNRANCKGPQKHNRCGADASNRVGPANLALGPSRFQPIAV